MRISGPPSKELIELIDGFPPSVTEGSVQFEVTIPRGIARIWERAVQHGCASHGVTCLVEQVPGWFSWRRRFSVTVSGDRDDIREVIEIFAASQEQQ